MALVAGPLVEDRVREERVETETDQKWLADLNGGERTSELE